jgi:hypothetical protein
LWLQPILCPAGYDLPFGVDEKDRVAHGFPNILFTIEDEHARRYRGAVEDIRTYTDDSDKAPAFDDAPAYFGFGTATEENAVRDYYGTSSRWPQ